MKKGITNMVRLHTTEAVSIPIEIRVHLLASSKDVIHSWAIPSAGIKIDCVPGYSSHRVAIFLLSGTYYGQCMEICGRFHHWMPIVVHFLKRDMFILWCAQMSLSRIKEYNQMNYPVVFSSNQWDLVNTKG
jgi:heme/copper-type cytochrome/quinol oxidase subunit 2